MVAVPPKGTAPSLYREARAAGLFYPASAQALRRAVDDCLSTVRRPAPAGARAIIVPHAGYRYSGPVAAHGFAALGPHYRCIRRVVILTSAHREGLCGVAAPAADAFLTPLGAVPVDREACNALGSSHGLKVVDEPHQCEHGIEVQLPFLQRTIGHFQLLPLLVGDVSQAHCDALIDAAWGEREDTVVVLSCDLSRYNPYEVAQALDERTRHRIERGEAERIEARHTCGHRPMRSLMSACRTRHLQPTTLCMRTSADCIGGDPNRAIGFGAFSYHR
ncbi:MAG: AmmeMemoRadiSam system protein B [Pseudomonadota bacterium]